MAKSSKWKEDRKIWWLPIENYHHQVGIGQSKVRDFITFKFNPYYCEECKHVWESFHNSSTNGNSVQRYKDFPTYKLERKTCPSCGCD
tara:strand:+ start:2210 stop:2473 length:264 start_codon:yes stop_codon:yes gene_type:complete